MDYFIKKKVRALAAGAAGRRHASCTWEEARRILVLYRADDRALVDPCLEKLRRMGKRVQVCLYTAGAPEAEAPDTLTVHAKRDLNAWQLPTEAILERFKALEADILIDLTPPGCYPMQYLMLQHPCGFKVGATQAGADLYDLSISVTEREDLKRLFEHILFYLQAIRSK